MIANQELKRTGGRWHDFRKIVARRLALAVWVKMSCIFCLWLLKIKNNRKFQCLAGFVNIAVKS